MVVEVNLAFVSTPPLGLPATLCGTLSLPSAEARNVPAVVLVHGTEPLSRNLALGSVPAFDRALDNADGTLDARLSFTPPLEVFRELARFLAENGYAVLRYDNRTFLAQNGSACGENPGSGPFTTYAQDYQSDSDAAVDILRSRIEVDTARVYSIGHGLGAALALEQAAAGHVRGAVLLGAGARPLDVLTLDRLERRLTYLQTLPPSEAVTQAIAAQHAELRSAEDGFARLRAGRFPITELLLGWGKFYWESWLATSDRTLQTYGRVQGPLLFIHGTQDFVVPGTELNRFGTPGQTGRVTLQRAAVTHALNAGSAGQLDAAALGSILSWLGAH